MLKPKPWLLEFSDLLLLSVVLKYGWKRFYKSSALMPIPESRTFNIILTWVGLKYSIPTEIAILPESSVNLIAFEIIFNSVC